MMPVKKSAKNDVSDGAFARLQHNSRYSLEFDVGLDETSPTYELKRREIDFWQRRFWEHQLRDDRDYERHVDYIHFNPVKHGLVNRVSEWEHSTFHQYVKRELYPHTWSVDPGRIGSDVMDE